MTQEMVRKRTINLRVGPHNFLVSLYLLALAVFFQTSQGFGDRFNDTIR